MGKIIRVNSCINCVHCADLSVVGDDDMYCLAFEDERDVNEFCKNKTIYPDCPLEDEYSDFQKQVLITAKEAEEIRQIEREKCIKNIRDVWEDNKQHDGIHVPMWLGDMCWQAIRADLNRSDSEIGGEDE